MSTIRDMQKFLEGRDPDEPVAWACWTEEDIDEVVTLEQATEILENFENNDAMWSYNYEALQIIADEVLTNED